ncbi:MAG: hypothetical protein ACI4IN_06520 [Eubacterium sp.]
MKQYLLATEKWAVLCSALRNASFNTLRGWGGILVSAELRDSTLFSALLKAERDAQITIINLPDSVEFIGGFVQNTDRGYCVSVAKGETVKILNKKFG